jgi:hypothetical protein
MESQTAPLVETIGDPDYPIWLLGDSPPTKYLHLKPPNPDHLTPLDPRHPSRHTIWTPILDVIQRHLFKECRRRLDDSELFIRNAVSRPDHKMKDTENQGAEIADLQVKEMIELRELLNRPNKPKPLLVLCFGQFAYACALRAQQVVIEKLLPQDWEIWGIPELSMEFRRRIDEVQLGRVTLLPLLHASAARSFPSATRHFSGGHPNYFEYVGKEIADKLIETLLKASNKDKNLDKLWL